MSGLSVEQQRRIEANRQRALAKRAERLALGAQNGHTPFQPASNVSTGGSNDYFQTGKQVQCLSTGLTGTSYNTNCVTNEAHCSTSVQHDQKENRFLCESTEVNPQSVLSVFQPASVLVLPKTPGNTFESCGSLPSSSFYSKSSSSTPTSLSVASESIKSSPVSNAEVLLQPQFSSTLLQSMTCKGSQCTRAGVPRGSGVQGCCVPLSPERFKVEVCYKAELIMLFKRIPSRLYDGESKTWSFSTEDHDSLLSDVHQIPGVRIEPLPGRTAPPPLNSSSTPFSGTFSVAAVMLVCHNWRKPRAVVRGQCVLMSRSRFILEVPYHADVVALCKAVRSRSYDTTTKQWSFLLEDYMDLMEQACQSHVFEIEPLPQAVVQAFLPQFQKSDKHREPIPDADLSSVDQQLTKNLLPFQLQGVNFAVAREGRLLIADDMGLGKTVQAICIAAYYRQDWPLLVVAPSSVRFTWAEAFRRWLPALDPQEIQVVVKCRDKPGAGVITIISYDLLSRMHTQLEELAFAFIIMDESHFLKNIKTVRCKAALPVMKKARRLLLLSGTPAMSRPMELYTQLMALQPRLFPNFHEFGLRYCAARRMHWGWDYSGSSHMTELRVLLGETLLIRRLKADVLAQLPAKQRKMIVVESGVVDARARSALAAAAKNSAGGKSLEKEALLLFFSKTAEAKVSAVNEYINDLLESTESKFLVFGHHKVMLDRVSHGLEKKV
uniref:SWI/SNF-related matrix-associated actin-dependent regulator of chromatin subfamily A-like protein 1 n=1 Tax=Eptatretus burgeri TaxID=7764 RepID=A0A8C4QQN8_EPTBU